MINLFVSYFNVKDKARQKELDFCREQHENNPYIDRIFSFENRPVYDDFFLKTQRYPNDINILSNADIYFDETIQYVTLIGPKQCYAITRTELDDKGNLMRFEDKHVHNKNAKAKHSQDVWVFKGAVKNVQGWFYLGVPGCDNRIAFEIFRAGYSLINPCYSINCIHKHSSPDRTYSIPDNSPHQIPKPWKWVMPTELNLRKPI